MQDEDTSLTTLTQRVSAIEDAFPRDDLGKPNYHSHRKQHLQDEVDSQKMSEIKDAAIQQIITWVIGIALALIGTYWGFIK